MIFFFFSSRRRHTRLQGDWSSDVCSSDLGWCTRGACDEAHVDGGELPVARVADQDQGGAGGLGNRVALVAAAGVVAGGDDRGLAVYAGRHLGEPEAVVAEVA